MIRRQSGFERQSVPTSFDIDMMRIALRMGARGLGQTAPNPAVGAVIADEETGEVVARGWTQPGGRPHAETEAIRRAGEKARGKTLYVTLEPCAHHGKTPPCADAIIKAGLKRVVVGVGDPDPRTAGQGIARLRAAGIDVTAHVLDDEARWLTLGHILRLTADRPFVTLKLATDADGHIPRGDGTAPRWATGPEARAAGHLLRAQADAILIGSGTLIADDPDLTCRLPGLAHRSPIRVVVAGATPLPAGARLFQSASAGPVWVIQPAADTPEMKAKDAHGIETIAIDTSASRVQPLAIARVLAARGMTRLLVEGGPALWRAFDAEGLADEVALFVAGHRASAGDAAAILKRHLATGTYKLIGRRSVGGDTLWRWARDPVAGRPLELAGTEPR